MDMQPYLESLSELCHPRSLQRARALAQDEASLMTRLVARTSSGDQLISASVVSSQGWRQHYKAVVQLADDGAFIRDFRCTCPAFLNYDGPCKHCAALLMDYAKRSSKYQSTDDSTAPRTTPLLSELMEHAALVRKEAAGAGSIELLPELRLEYDLWFLRLRIASPDAAYVVRDLRKLVEDVRSGARVEYGKKLRLTHSRSVFTERSQQLIGLLESIMDQQRGPFGAWQGRSTTHREAILSNRDLAEFLDIMEDATFAMEGDGLRMSRKLVGQVVREDPPLEMRLVAEDDGYLLVRDTEALPIVAGQRAFVLVDGTFYRCSPTAARAMAALGPLFDQRENRLFVSRRDAARFCATLLPQLEEAAQVQVPASLESLRPVPGQLEFYFDKVGKAVEGAVQVRYGRRVYPLAGEGPHGAIESLEAEEGKAPLRDDALEQAALGLMREYFPRDLRIPLAEEAIVGDLLFGGLARFRAAGEVFTTPAFDRLLTESKPRFQLGISLSGDLIAMDVTVEDLPPDELAALLASYRKKKRFHRLRSGAFVDVADLDLRQMDVLMDDLGVTVEQLASGHFQLPTYSAFFLDREFADAHRNVAFTDYVQRLDALDPTRYPVPDGLCATLRPYQVEGFQWLSSLVDMGLGGVLADEMGLGKTLQLISLLQARRTEARETGPSLIVCPASLVYNWVAECKRFAPSLAVRAVTGTKAERARIRRDSQADVLVTSYDLLRIDVKAYEDRAFFCCVLDEAQAIKNHATLTTRAVKRVQARHRLALTGTPMENRLAELWSIFDFLMPGFLGSYARFRERYEISIVGGDELLAERLRHLVGPFILRRLKADVLTELPDKLETVVRVELVGEQRRLYAASEQRLREELTRQKKTSSSRANRRGVLSDEEAGPKVEVLAELTRLRQMALDPGLVLEDYRGGAAKLEAIMELLDQARESGQKMLLFSQFTSFLKEVAQRLEAEGVPYFMLTGSTPKKRRVQLADAFNADDTPVFLISLKAGGTGLNLTGASMVVHADPWWNAAAQNQASDRAHRIGQRSTVNVYKVIAADTIEERIVELQQKKTDLADAVIGASGVEALSRLTRDQLLELLG